MTAVGAGARTKPIAGMIGLAFGGLWSCLGAASLPPRLQSPLEAVGVLVTVALVTVLWRRRGSAGPGGGGLFRRPGYIIAVFLEVAAIYAASTVLNHYGLKGYIIPAVGAIVGLHFIGLWQATRLSVFLWIAGCMCGVSAVSACLPETWAGFDPRNVVAGFGNAVVLWIGAGQPRRGM